MNDRPVKFRWVLLIGIGFWLFVVVSWAAGLTEPGVFTFGRTFVVPVLWLVVIWPVSVARLARWRWFHPAVAVWVALSVPLLNVANISLFGIGRHCLGVSVVAGIAGFIVINAIGLLDNRRRRAATSRSSRPRREQPIVDLAAVEPPIAYHVARSEA